MAMPLSRSENMARIRGSGTRPETVLAAALARAGIAVLTNEKVEGVRADLVLADARRAIFIDGCFWHGCPAHYARPRSNADFWSRKLPENVERDRRQTAHLEGCGWKVVRIWEHLVFEDLEAAVALADAHESGANETAKLRVVRVEVVSKSPLVERRLLATLRDPAVIVAAPIGPRVTAKWRRPRSTPTPTPRSPEPA